MSEMRELDQLMSSSQVERCVICGKTIKDQDGWMDVDEVCFIDRGAENESEVRCWDCLTA